MKAAIRAAIVMIFVLCLLFGMWVCISIYAEEYLSAFIGGLIGVSTAFIGLYILED